MTSALTSYLSNSSQTLLDLGNQLKSVLPLPCFFTEDKLLPYRYTDKQMRAHCSLRWTGQGLGCEAAF